MTLDPMPTARELRRIASERGGETEVTKERGALPPKAHRPSVRPWHPYRSKWEWEYAAYLDLLKAAKQVDGWWYEEHSFLIGVGAKYTPDFLVVWAGNRAEYHEVKGYRREAAMVRIKAAALAHPNERFILVSLRNGQWHHQPIGK